MATALRVVAYLEPAQAVVETGDQVNFCCEAFVDGALTAPTSATLRLRTPDNAANNYTLAGAQVLADTSPVRVRFPLSVSLAGRHSGVWTIVAGGLAQTQSFEMDVKKVAVP